jgi:hypothetical protein
MAVDAGRAEVARSATQNRAACVRAFSRDGFAAGLGVEAPKFIAIGRPPCTLSSGAPPLLLGREFKETGPWA